MKVGDLVVRGYSWYAIVPGIIVDVRTDIITTSNESEAYEEAYYVVQWSDGSLSEETYYELDYFTGQSEDG